VCAAPFSVIANASEAIQSTVIDFELPFSCCSKINDWIAALARNDGPLDRFGGKPARNVKTQASFSAATSGLCSTTELFFRAALV
jgi:hypothetical protein